jgi:hypothetical protein
MKILIVTMKMVAMFWRNFPFFPQTGITRPASCCDAHIARIDLLSAAVFF